MERWSGWVCCKKGRLSFSNIWNLTRIYGAKFLNKRGNTNSFQVEREFFGLGVSPCRYWYEPDSFKLSIDFDIDEALTVVAHFGNGGPVRTNFAL